jgi:type IV pilus assembly protein PilQ
MMSRSTSESQHDRRSGWVWLPPRWLVASLVLSITLVSAAGWREAKSATEPEQAVLQAVDISPLAGNRLQIRFRLSEMPKEPPSSFTINEPARIVLDFLGTRNGLDQRQQAINVGVADKISVLEGADRTRASLNLARLVPYTVQVQGSAVVLTLENAGAAAAKTPSVTPVTAVKAAAASAPRTDASGPVTTVRNVSDVSFKRGPGGQGVITVKLSNPAIPVDVRQEGNQIIADFQGATLKRGQERRLDVIDFATPVSLVEALNRAGNARLTIKPNPPFEYLAYQANDLYVVEVRPPQKSKEQEDKEAQFDPSKKKYVGDLLSLNFQDIEVRAILQILADFTGLNIVVSDSVKGNLTLRLQNVPWDQALDIILRTKGLAMRQNGNVIFIAPTEEVAAREKLDLESRKVVDELIPLRTEIIQVNYAKAKDLGELLKKKGVATDKGVEQSILSPRGAVETDERTNSLIVKDIPEKLAEIRDLVTKLDVPNRQVMIDSRIVIANDDFARDIGVRFGVTGVTETDSGIAAISGDLSGTNTIVNSAVNNLTSTGQPFPVAVPSLAQRLGVQLPAAPGGGGNPARLALSILAADYLVDLELSALQTEGKGEIVSNPRVVTANLKKASIQQGRQIPYSEVDDDGKVSTLFKDAVLKLEVTPQITPDDRIRMDLKVTKDDVGANVPQATGGFVPSIDKREVETQVLVNNGETVVLGGVFEQNKTKGNDKVPLLGDIPLLGYLFQRNSDLATKRELLIFVTPQILKTGSTTD